jgi:hypothetical protein
MSSDKEPRATGKPRNQAENDATDGSSSVDESDVSPPAAPGDIGEGPDPAQSGPGGPAKGR